jgi:hypothetical protein
MMPAPTETGRLRIGIQTEQIFDKTRKRMWRAPKREDREAFVRAYDVILDLSPDNRYAYRFLPVDLRRKIRFGPHIFPDHDLTGICVAAPPLFVGWLNDRRRAVLDRLREDRPIDTLSRKVFGAELDQQLARQGAILNIHFQDGVYSEYPRFLKACLAGKLVLSEHTPEATGRIFASLRELASAYRFRAFLESVLKKARAGT